MKKILFSALNNLNPPFVKEYFGRILPSSIVFIDDSRNMQVFVKTGICNGRNFYFGFYLGLPAKIFWNETESQWQFTMKSYGKELLLFYSVDNYSQNPPCSNDGLWRDNNSKCSMKKLYGSGTENEITQNYFLN